MASMIYFVRESRNLRKSKKYEVLSIISRNASPSIYEIVVLLVIIA